MTLYRTYRPQSFAEVIGQKHITETLQNAVDQDRIAHAYLFSGSRGTGKTSIARILAKAIFIRSLEECVRKEQILRALQEGNMIDLLEIDAASNGGIDEIRSILENMYFPPILASAKVTIIDEAHMLSKSACDALLKTLEEPPSHAYFILATTELWKIPNTIQSRCQRFSFNMHTEEDVVMQLASIAHQEIISIDESALKKIAHHANGSMRDGITLLDQLRTEGHITEDIVHNRLGTGKDVSLENIFTALMHHDTVTILTALQAIEQAAVPFDNILREMLTKLRTQLHMDLQKGNDTRRTLHMLHAILNTLRAIRTSPLPALTVEAALIALCESQSDDASASAKVEPVVNQDEGDDPELEQIQHCWPRVVEQMLPPSAKMSLKTGQLLSCKKHILTICFPSAFHHQKVIQPEAMHTMQNLLQKQIDYPVRIRCIVKKERTDIPIKPYSAVDLAKAAREVF